MKYIRWIFFGLIAIVLIVLLILVSANKKLRQKVEVLLLERFVKNKVKDLEDKASNASIKAKIGKMEAEKAEEIAEVTHIKILKQKKDLQEKLEHRGLTSDEISTRFNNLSI